MTTETHQKSDKKPDEKSDAIKSQKKLTKKALRNLKLHKVACVARAILILSLFSLIGIGITGAARALTLEDIANDNGLPGSWQVASVGNPDTITVDMTYFDQKMDSCQAKVRQFEWCGCSGQCVGSFQQGIVKNYLGADHLPIPSYATQTASAAAGINKASQWVTGSEPVLAIDNFYRWFHEVAGVSKRYDRQITFTRQGNTNTYTYGGSGIFPLDDIRYDSDSVSKNDSNARTHNFSFTAHMTVPVKIGMDGLETFSFSGDDDVWVFLNDTLVLDIGGLHSALGGEFTVNADGTVTSKVNGVPAKVINAGLQKNRVYNLEFFYAERSTSESNTKITITNMNWPIAADATLSGEVVDNKLISYTSSLSNIDPDNPLYLTHLAAYVNDQDKTSGFLPLNSKLVSYTYTPSDPSSWTPLEISAPGNGATDFALATPLAMSPSGIGGDTIYFKFYAQPDEIESDGVVNTKVSYLTANLYGDVGISYDSIAVKYAHIEPVVPAEELDPEPEPEPEPKDPEPSEPEDPKEPETPAQPIAPTIPEPETPETPEIPKAPTTTTPTNPTVAETTTEAPKTTESKPINQTIPSTITYYYDMSDATFLDDADFAYLDPLGVVAYAPDTGAMSEIAAAFFADDSFAAVILSQCFVIANLSIFAIAFATYYALRKY